jgi:hypothetical protein
MTSWTHPQHARIGGQNYDRFLIRGKLTDKKIAAYRASGRYAEGKATRREIAEMRRAAKASSRREGNFEIQGDGRLVYRPT